MIVIIIEIIMKFIAFIKQSFVAYSFGSNQNMDCFFTASDFMVSISDILINAVKIAIMGIYANTLIKEGRKSGDTFMSKLFYFFVPISFILSIAIALTSPLLAKVLAPAFNAEQSYQLQKTVIMLSGIIFLSTIATLYESVLNTNKVFTVTKIRSFIYSICVILVCLFASQYGIKALIAAQYASFVVHILIQRFSSKKYFKMVKTNPLKNKYFKKIAKTMMPIIISNSITRINYIIDKAVASGIGSGIISALAYCQTLDQFVVVIIINSISSILFAHFTELVVKNKQQAIHKTLNSALSALSFVLIPVTIVTLFEARNIVDIIYGRGNFTENDILLASIALQGYSIRYLFAGIRDIIIQAEYSYGETKRPMIIAGVSTIVNITASILLAPRLGILAIALGTSASAIIGATLNIFLFKKINPSYSFKPLLIIFWKSLPAAIIATLFSFIIKFMALNKYIEFPLLTVVIFISYLSTLYIERTKELKELASRLKKILNQKFVSRKQNTNKIPK